MEFLLTLSLGQLFWLVLCMLVLSVGGCSVLIILGLGANTIYSGILQSRRDHMRKIAEIEMELDGLAAPEPLEQPAIRRAIAP